MQSYMYISYPVMEGKYRLTLNINSNEFTDPIISDKKMLPVKFVKVLVRFSSEHDSQRREHIITGYSY